MNFIKECLQILSEKDEPNLDLELNDPIEDDASKKETDKKDKPEDQPEDKPKVEKPPKEEEPAPPSSFKDLFDKNSDKMKTYSRAELFDAKELTGEEEFKSKGRVIPVKKGQYLLRNHDDVKKIKIVPSKIFSSDYETVRPNARPDAEGFLLVRPSGAVQAFEYTEEPIEIENSEKEKVTVKRGYFVVRYEDDEEGGWLVPKNEFKNTYK